MNIEPLSINGSYLIQNDVFFDERGAFHEWFHNSKVLEKTGVNFEVKQANVSKSQRTTLRGIHFSLAEEGQSKLVTCVSGSILDVIVDLRQNSPTYKESVYVTLSSQSRTSVLIGPGLGHAFYALEDETVVTYLLSSYYSKDQEFTISPFDLDLAIKWPTTNVVMSSRDRLAPELHVLETEGLLPKI